MGRGKEKENSYPGLIPISPDLKKAIAAVIGVPCAITPFLTACQRPKPAMVEQIRTPTPELVPTYTPTPKVEVASIPDLVETPIPEKIEREVREESGEYRDFWLQILASKKEIISSEESQEPKPVKHRVQLGDTLWGIAERYGLPWQAIYGKNISVIGQNSDLLKPKQVLVIPDLEKDRELIEVCLDLSQQYPQAWKELPNRVEEVIAYFERIKQIGPDFSKKSKPIELSNPSAYYDLRVFGEYGMKERGLSLTKENLFFTLAWYELEYAQPIEENPNFRRAMGEMAPAIRVVNEIIKDKLSPEEFIGQKIPQIPENPQRRLLFGDDNRGGRFFPEIFVIEEMRNSDSEKYRHLLKYLAGVVPHELIHAWPQNLFIGQHSSWNHQAQEKYDSTRKFIAPGNRKYHLAHMSMCSLTAPAQEKLGFEPGIEPRIVYLYSRLKENGVEDPYGLIVQAGATMNSDKLWEIYEKVRREDDLSLDELIATNDPIPDFVYYTPEEFEAFRAEYAPYLERKMAIDTLQLSG